jgi:hypothetical protein
MRLIAPEIINKVGIHFGRLLDLIADHPNRHKADRMSPLKAVARQGPVSVGVVPDRGLDGRRQLAR